MTTHPDLFPVILAGGASSRLWPASNRERPKWDLRLFKQPGETDARTLIETAWERATAVAPVENCFVVCGGAQADLVRRTLPQLADENLLVEPLPRDTSGAVAYATGGILRRINASGALTASMAKMLVLPGDHVISPAQRFAECAFAASAASTELDALVTFGIVPREPAIGYGYVQRGDAAHVPGIASDAKIYRVRAFKEKPDRATAEQYVKSGEYYWNGGIFVWRISTLMSEFQRQLPLHAEMARVLGHAHSAAEWDAHAQEFFPRLTKISIDFGILEHAATVATVAADFNWDDIGSWSALAPYLDRQDDNALGPGSQLIAVDSARNLVFASGKRVALVGVEGLAVVADGNDILICPLARDQDVKKVSERANAPK